MRTRILAWFVLGLCLAVPVRAEEPAEPPEAAGPASELPLPRALREVGSGFRRVKGVMQAGPAWLAAHQSADGHWSAASFDRWCLGVPIERQEPLPGAGKARQDVAVTSLALCAFVGSGWTHRGRHLYAHTVSAGLGWLKAQQAASGRIGPADPVGGLRAHALATLALTEIYGMTESLIVRGTARKALVYLLEQQGEDGAWPREDGSGEDDLLGTFLAMLPLKSLHLIEADQEHREQAPLLALDTVAPFRRLRRWLDAHTDEATGLVSAAGTSRPRPEEHPVLLTAAGLLARSFLGDDIRHHPVAKAAAKHLADHVPSPDATEPEGDLTYIYFGTLALFQMGGMPWKTWNESLTATVADGRRRDGTRCGLKGSWDPHGPWVRSLGRVGATAITLSSLTVYYRYGKVFGSADGGRTVIPLGRAEPRTWRSSSLPPHAATFHDRAHNPLPIESARLSAEIHGVRARVVMDLWVRNPTSTQREGTLRLRLPDGAAPYYLAFGDTTRTVAIPFRPKEAVRTGLAALNARASGSWGAVKEARMAPTKRARHAYREVVRSTRDPALLTWAGAGVFDLGIFPLFPGKLHRVVLGYEVDLTAVGDAHKLRLDLPEGVPDVAAALRVVGGAVETFPEASVVDGVHRWVNPTQRSIRVITRPSGDVVLQGPDTAGHDHVAAWIRPDIEALSIGEPPSRALVLLDASASGKAEPFAIRVQLLETLLEANRPELASFKVGVFDTEVRWWRDGFTPNTAENVAAFRAFAETLELGGATDLKRALGAAATVEGDCDVFLLSDGAPTWGPAELDVLAQAHGRGRRIYAYRTGLPGEDLRVLEALAEGSGGALISVLGENDMAAAARAHRYGTWHLAQISIAGVTDLLVAGRPTTIHHGQQLRLVGRGRPEAGASLVVGLERGDVRKTLRIPLPKAIPSAMAARAYGHAAVVELEALGSPRWEQALAYASHYRVVRESASLIMLESEKDYHRFGLEEVDHTATIAAEPVGPVLPPSKPSTLPEPAPPLTRLVALLGRLLRVADGHVEMPPPLLRALEAVPPDRLVAPRSTGHETRRVPSRELGGRLDERPDSLEARLAAAFDAWEAGRRAHAYAVLREGVTRHPDARVLPWLLARLAESTGRNELALLWFEVALGLSADRGSRDLIHIVARDYVRFLGHVRAGRRSMALEAFAAARARSLECLALASEADLVVLLVSSSPEHDLELCVIDPEGRRQFRRFHESLEAAEFVGTSPLGEGPKMFVAPRADAETYAVQVVQPAGQQLREISPPQGLVTWIRNWGRADEQISVRMVTLREAGEVIPIDPPGR